MKPPPPVIRTFMCVLSGFFPCAGGPGRGPVGESQRSIRYAPSPVATGLSSSAVPGLRLPLRRHALPDDELAALEVVKAPRPGRRHGAHQAVDPLRRLPSRSARPRAGAGRRRWPSRRPAGCAGPCRARRAAAPRAAVDPASLDLADRTGPCAVSRGAIVQARWATMSPASGAFTMWCSVTPVSSSPSTSTQLIGARPRRRGGASSVEVQGAARRERRALRRDHVAVEEREDRSGACSRRRSSGDDLLAVDDGNLRGRRDLGRRPVPAVLRRIVPVGDDRDHLVLRSTQELDRAVAHLAVAEEEDSSRARPPSPWTLRPRTLRGRCRTST